MGQRHQRVGVFNGPPVRNPYRSKFAVRGPGFLCASSQTTSWEPRRSKVAHAEGAHIVAPGGSLAFLVQRNKLESCMAHSAPDALTSLPLDHFRCSQLPAAREPRVRLSENMKLPLTRNQSDVSCVCVLAYIRFCSLKHTQQIYSDEPETKGFQQSTSSHSVR